MIKIAIIGCGNMGKNHIRICSQMPNINIQCLIDKNMLVEDVHMIANEYGLTSGFITDSYEIFNPVIKAKDFDAVIVATPTDTHFQIAKYFLERNVDVFIEKPMTKTCIDANELTSIARRKKAILMVGHIERFNPVIFKLREKLSLEDRILGIKTYRRNPMLPKKVHDDVVSDLMIHDIDVVRSLLNCEPIIKYVFKQKVYSSYKPDECIAICKYNHIPVVHTADRISNTYIRKIEVSTEEKFYVADYINQILYIYNKPEVNTRDFITTREKIKCRGEPLRIELGLFFTCVNNRVQPLTNGVQGVLNLKAVEDILRY